MSLTWKFDEEAFLCQPLRLIDVSNYSWSIPVHLICVCEMWNSLHLLPQIIILWNSEKPPPNRSKWPPMPVPLTVTDGRRKVSANTTHTVPCSDVWVTVWQTVSRSVCLSLSLSFSIYLGYSISLVLPLDVYFSLSLLPIHVYLTCPPIRVAFAFVNVSHSQCFFSVSLSQSDFFPLPRQNL